MQSFVADIRHAIRVLARAPGFTLICVATLGVAIGATTAIFSIANPVLFKPLPYPDAARLVTVYERETDGAPSFMGYATYLDLRRGARTLQSAAALGDWRPTLFGDQDAERVSGQRVSWQFFRTLGVRPALGRDFQEADDTQGADALVILSHGLWTRRFGSDSGIIGQAIDIGGLKRTVIGVMPASFEDAFDRTTQVWRILGYGVTDPWACRTCRHLQFVARLRDDATRESAERELSGLMTRIVSDHPKDYAVSGTLVIGLQELITENAKPILLAILGAIALVLLISVANVVNLQLARAIRRFEEFAVRAALGAGRGRLAQQLLAEGLTLASLGGVVGVVTAAVVLPLLVVKLPPSLPRLSAIALDWQALSLAAAVVLVVGIAVGMAPALQAGRQHLFDVLRGGGRAIGSAHHRTRAGLVISEVALAMMLLVGATLLARSIVRLLAVDAGFDASNLVTMEVQASGVRYDSAAKVFANHDRIREAVRALPGVIDVGLTSQLPLGGNVDRQGIAAQDKPLENPELSPSADRYAVSWEFMRAMRVPVLRGRAFTEAEANDSSGRVAIVSDVLARRIWPGEDGVGKYIRMGGETRPWWRVIGVAGNVRHSGLDAPVTHQVYVPERQWFWEESVMVLVVRTRGDAASMVNAVREAVHDVDPLQPITKVSTMDGVVARSTAQRRLGLMLFAAFGVVALLLATAGIYGVLAGSVSERTRELGVRTALGATPGSLVALVVRQGAVMAVSGLVLGSAGAFALTRYMQTLLYQVEADDPLSVTLAVVAVLVVSLAACMIPARRATRVDPMTALRAD